jgi:hypothetical protein
MLRSSEEILADIDTTLDQLIQYADVAQNATLNLLEVEALQKTQESLLARLIHMETLLSKERTPAKTASFETVQQKIAQYSRLNARLIDGVASQFTRKSSSARRLKSSKK